MVGIMHTRQRLTAESNCVSGHIPSGPSSISGKKKTPKPREGSSTTTVGARVVRATGRTREGCNRPNHSREFCRLRNHSHPDFLLPWKGTAEAPTPPKKKDKDKPQDKDYYRSNRGNNDSDRRVWWSEQRYALSSRNCGGTDTNSTYHQYLVSLSASSTYFTALTLFDTGAYTSFVNREVEKWLEQRQERDTEGFSRNRTSNRHDIPTSTMNSSVYGSVDFDLTLFNEVTRSDYVLRDIKASVIDSCIEVIIWLPDIRSHRLILLIPSYFDTLDPTYLEPQTISQGDNPKISQDLATLSLLAPSRKSIQNAAEVFDLHSNEIWTHLVFISRTTSCPTAMR